MEPRYTKETRDRRRGVEGVGAGAGAGGEGMKGVRFSKSKADPTLGGTPIRFPAKNKYRAKRTSCGLHEHASKKEARKCGELTLLAKGGVIHDLEQQPRFSLYAYNVEKKSCEFVGEYRADFRYQDLDRWVVLDVKGMRTPMYLWKKKMMKACWGIEVQEA